MKRLLQKGMAKRMAMLVAVGLPLVVGGAPASAGHSGFDSVEGVSSGLERRAGAIPIAEGTCNVTSPPQPDFWKFTAKASYRYPLADTATPPPANGYAEITGRDTSDPNHPDLSYSGVVNVAWFAPEVWDGPRATTQAFATNTAANCDWGYEWPVTSGSIVSVGNSNLSCPSGSIDPGTAGSPGTNGTAGSYYSRPLDGSGNPGSEVIRLVFTSCTVDGGTIANAVVTLYDPAHAACVDLNAHFGAVGVSHCESNYQIETLPLP